MIFITAKRIVRNRYACRRAALKAFAHTRKVNAILYVAEKVAEHGFAEVKRKVHAEGLSYLQTFPFIGPVTTLHLAKNIGLDVVKPDRHLVRAAKSAGVSSPQELCERIRDVVGDTLSVIDLVIWRYATLNPHYLREFALAVQGEDYWSTMDC